MQPMEIPECPRLRGEKAIEALNDFIDELVARATRVCGDEPIDKQTIAMIKLAKGLRMRAHAHACKGKPSKLC